MRCRRTRGGTAYFTPSVRKGQGAFIFLDNIRRKTKMKLYDELVARCLISQVTNEEEISDMI